MKKLIAVALVLVLALSLVACSSETNNTQGNKDVKIGVILVHDENTGYDEAHINGIKRPLKLRHPQRHRPCCMEIQRTRGREVPRCGYRAC